MAHGRDVYDEELGRPRCTANAKSSGERCRRRPVPGAAVCPMHGGKAPQVAKSARRRLLDAVDPAISTLVLPLEEAVRRAETEAASGTISDATLELLADLRLVSEAVLDRTGYPRRSELDLGDARGRLLERLRAQVDEREATA